MTGRGTEPERSDPDRLRRRVRRRPGVEWTGRETAGLVLFWIGLLLGASTFTGRAAKLFTKGKLGIGLLMTISASAR